MEIPLNKYCGDAKMIPLLEQLGAKMSLSQIYGLFYGCLSAPELVMPSAYHSLIFGEEGAEFGTEEEVQTVVGSLMALWNLLSRWDPAVEDFILPDIKYENNYGGLIKRVEANHAFVESFVLGLALGEVYDSDFSEDGRLAMEDLVTNGAYMFNYAEALQREKLLEEKAETEDIEAVNGLENIMADCIARINIGLEDARVRSVNEMRMMSTPPPAASPKIPRNAPCPCGSGKKYKKCCGMVH